MRLPSWVGVGLSIFVLTAIGTVGIFVNQSALRAADDVHRTDSRALGVNNATLAGQFQLLSAKELNELATSYKFDLEPDDGSDRTALRRLAEASDFFRYGAAITDLNGKVLTATRSDGLPSPDDAGLAPVRTQLLSGNPGFSSVLEVDGQYLTAAAVPILSGTQPVAILVGFTSLKNSQLQAYLAKLSTPQDLISIVDSTGRIAASSDPGRIGTTTAPAVTAGVAAVPADNFVNYQASGSDMIAVVVGGIPGGWAYVREQTLDSFNGAIVSRNRTTTFTLLGMLLIGVAGVTLLGHRIQVQRRRSEQRFQALFQHAPDVVAVLDEDGRAVYASPSAATLLGVDGRLLMGASIFDFVHPEDRARLETEFQELLKQHDGVLRRQSRIITAQRGFRWLEFTASNQMHNPSLNGVVINARDVTESRMFQDRLAHEAQHDALTGLPNRRRMNDRLHELMRDQAVGVLFIDLDGFKPVNDEYGHEAGDELLRQVAERLIGQLRPHELLSRVGGDEFVVLMPGMVRYFEAQAIADILRRTIEVPFQVGSDQVRISASIGVHLATPADNPDHVLRAADHAMYAIKKAGGGRAASGQHPANPIFAGRHRSGQ